MPVVQTSDGRTDTHTHLAKWVTNKEPYKYVEKPW